jgi:putative hemolysin
MSDPFPWGAVVGAVLSGLGAAGAKVAYEFSRHDLECYCRRRNQPELFDEILARHEEVGVAAESLQILGTVLLVFSVFHTPAAASAADRLADGSSLPYVLLALVLGLLALTIWIPWAIVHVASAPFLFHTWRVWVFLAWLGWPLTLLAKLVSVAAHRLAGRHEETDEDQEEALEDEIRTIVTAGLRDGLLEAETREMIEGVMELGDVHVAEIMTPRSEIDALDINLSWPEMLRFVVDAGRTRLPVYQDKLDHVIGILFVKDLLPELTRDGPGTSPTSLRERLREPWFVPETKAVDDLLREFRRTRSHMAIVVDEYRAVAGVVTIEDALEEIVGEIADESDTEEEVDLVRLDDTTLEVDGRVHIEELNEQFGLMFPQADDFDTIAGFVVTTLGRIPKSGEVIDVESVRLTVVRATLRRVERVRLEWLPQPEAP